mmetsp:Transcript_13035/g.31462  ORF Transcript_13035/g.31462 Transcript_13035/m.31462 type:complete len:513 (-) Transcript_13035:8-1546(-)
MSSLVAFACGSWSIAQWASELGCGVVNQTDNDPTMFKLPPGCSDPFEEGDIVCFGGERGLLVVRQFGELVQVAGPHRSAIGTRISAGACPHHMGTVADVATSPSVLVGTVAPNPAAALASRPPDAIVLMLKPMGIALDASHTHFYISDAAANRVLKFPLSPSNPMHYGVVVAGRDDQSSGNSLGALNSPTGIAVSLRLFIADTGNHRVLAWDDFAKEGQLVAGTGEAGSSLHQLHTPSAVLVDADIAKQGRGFRAVFVADAGNHRVLRWRAGYTRGEYLWAVPGAALFPSALAWAGQDILMTTGDHVWKFTDSSRTAERLPLSNAANLTGLVAVTRGGSPQVYGARSGELLRWPLSDVGRSELRHGDSDLCLQVVGPRKDIRLGPPCEQWDIVLPRISSTSHPDQCLDWKGPNSFTLWDCHQGPQQQWTREEHGLCCRGDCVDDRVRAEVLRNATGSEVEELGEGHIALAIAGWPFDDRGARVLVLDESNARAVQWRVRAKEREAVCEARRD